MLPLYHSAHKTNEMIYAYTSKFYTNKLPSQMFQANLNIST